MWMFHAHPLLYKRPKNSTRAEKRKELLQSHPIRVSPSLPPAPPFVFRPICIPPELGNAISFLMAEQKNNVLQLRWTDMPLFSRDLSFGFSLFCKVRRGLSQKHTSISMTTTLLKNNLPFRVRGRTKILLGCRYVNALNSQLRAGKITLNPLTGVIQAHVSWSLDEKNHFQDSSSSESTQMRLRQQLKKIHQTSLYLINFNFLSLLQVLSELPENAETLIPDVQTALGMGLRKLRASLEGAQLLEGILKIADIEAEFMTDKNRLKRHLAPMRSEVVATPTNSSLQISQDSMIQQNESIKVKRFNEYTSSKEVKLQYKMSERKILEAENQQKSAYIQGYLRDQSCHRTAHRPILQSYFSQFSGVIPQVRTHSVLAKQVYNIPAPIRYQQAPERQNIYSEIKVLEEDRIRWSDAGAGGYAKIYRGLAKYSFVSEKCTNESQSQSNQKTKEEVFQKVFARKKDFASQRPEGSDFNHVAYEKLVAKSMSQFSCNNIVRCYQASSTNLKNDLLMDYYYQKSYDIYQFVHATSHSLMSKFNIAGQIANGVCFLKDVGIVHRDLKPQNLLVSKGSVIKVTDFGESTVDRDEVVLDGVRLWSDRNLEPPYKSGHTMPYTAPQIFQIKSSQCDKTSAKPSGKNQVDNFAVGMMLYEIVFGNDLINYRKQSHVELARKYRAREYMKTVLVAPERGRRYYCTGLKGVEETITLLCLRLVAEESWERACAGWTLVVMRLLYQYFYYHLSV